MPDLRNSKLWDRQLEGGLPDCRAKDGPTIVRARMAWRMVFCANCHEPGGYATEHVIHMFYLCDKCAPKHGDLDSLGLVEVPDEVARGRAAQDAAKKFGAKPT